MNVVNFFFEMMGENNLCKVYFISSLSNLQFVYRSIDQTRNIFIDESLYPVGQFQCRNRAAREEA